MSVTSDLMQFVPANASRCVIEERMHRGQAVFAVFAIVPNGSTVCLNGYSDRELAESTCSQINASIQASMRCPICHEHDGHSLSCPTRWYR